MNSRPLKLVAVGLQTAFIKKPAAQPGLQNHEGMGLDPNVLGVKDLKLAAAEQDQFARLATDAPDSEAVRFAFDKITNQTLLSELALEGATDFIRLAAIPRVMEEAALAKFAMHTKLIYCNPNIDRLLEDLEKLIAASIDAVNRITNQLLLAKLATAAENSDVRKAAMKQLEDPALVAKIALEDKDFVVRFATIGRLTDQAVLEKIAQEDPHTTVRDTAARRLAHLKSGQD